jgi:hypothetical protein
MSDGFLGRWSRRKHEARCATAEAPAADAAPAPPLTSDELDALPRLEELTAESDITAFLRRGVPESLRNAALRKAWLLDPAIRDFPGHARDYAWDWNTPGGLPGSGPLHPSTAVAAMLRRGGDEIACEDASTDAAAGDHPDNEGDKRHEQS